MLKNRELSQQQQLAVRMAFLGKSIVVGKNAPNYSSNQTRLKLLLLRAYIIYKRHHHLDKYRLLSYRLDFHSRLQAYLKLDQNNYHLIPNYLFIFLEDIDQYLLYKFSSHLENQIKNPKIPDTKFISNNKISTSTISTINQQTRKQKFKFNYHLTWAKLCLAICTNHPLIISFKKYFGCISLIPITIKNEHIKIENVCIHYHDLCHLEVARLDRIQMGKYMVSGIHGISARVFHKYPIVREYDGFLDEARIAIHEWLTRTTIFSSIKVICWLILLILYGINPIAVVIRHFRSLKKKQNDLKIYSTQFYPYI